MIQGASRLRSIQYLRAFAALMVVAFHVLGAAWTVGSAGVDIFFVISGFVIALVANSTTVTPRRFAYDRAVRVLPLYWLCTLALAAAAALVPALFPRLPLTAEWLAKSLAMLPAFRPGSSDVFPVLYQGWTLNYEVFFYAIVLLAILRPASQRFPVIAAILLGFVAVGHWLPSSQPWVSVYTDPLLVEFLVGYGFGHLRLRGLRFARGSGLALIGLGLIGLGLAAATAEGPEGWRRILVWGMPAICLVVGSVTIEDREALPTLPLAGLLGEASYAIYLTHGMAISLLVAIWRRLGAWTAIGLDTPILAAATFGLAVTVGVAFHRVVEAPMLRRLRRRRVDRIGTADAT